jgi:hypothetical protein
MTSVTFGKEKTSRKYGAPNVQGRLGKFVFAENQNPS